MQTVKTHFGNVSKKCRYGLRAIFELSLRDSKKPVKVHEIAKSQAIPVRFLEVILNELKQGGFVESRRGNEGGYLLARPADRIFVGQILNFIQGTNAGQQKNGFSCEIGTKAPGDLAFAELWNNINTAVTGIYKNTTFMDLVKQEMVMSDNYVADYVI